MLETDLGAQTARQLLRMRLGAPPVPNDHSAYAMLLVPMLLGFVLGTLRGTAWNTTPPEAFTLFVLFALFTVSLISLFFASEPVRVAFRPRAGAAARGRALPWLGMYVLVEGLAGAPLLLVWKRP
ncbi:MAG: YwiC-like family protein [Chloroflexota bacterium]|nr:YwiC-like family protein [Chloroflexota bacterium]